MPVLPKLRLFPWMCVIIAFITLAVYSPTLRCEFVNYDDPYYVTQNAHVLTGLTWENLKWALTARHSSNWHPLTWVSHMLDCQLYGLNPAGHHATNLLFHTANAVLLFVLLRRMTGALWRSAFAAALFALHPLHVESVAWVAERKDVLSTFFLLLTIWSYVHYAENPRPRRYASVVVFFVLGLMSKPMLVTLPFLLLLLDYWPLKRIPCSLPAFGNAVDNGKQEEPIQYRSVSIPWWILEKIPLLLLSLISCVLTLWAQTESIVINLPLSVRVVNAVLAYLRYIEKMAWPSPLFVNYPYPRFTPTWHIVIAILLLGSASVLAVRERKRLPFLFTGWFWFLGALVPTIGIVQVGLQSLADRYSYIPLIGLFIIVAWGGHELITRLRLRPVFATAAGAVVLAGCIFLTFRQVGYWKDSVVLFRHALRFAPDNFVAQYNLGLALMARQQLDEAAGHFAEAARIAPSHAQSHSYLGQVLVWQGKFTEAIGPFQAALHYDPTLAEAHYGLGVALIKTRNAAEAIGHLTMAIDRLPAFWEAHDELGLILVEQGKEVEALRHFSEATRLCPGNPMVHSHLAMTLHLTGRTAEAISQYCAALKLDPDNLDVLNNLAWILATNPNSNLRNGNEAIKLAAHACELTHYQRPILVGTLGMAYAEAGRFAEAITTAQNAEALANAAGNKGVAEICRSMIELFRSGKPFRETTAPP